MKLLFSFTILLILSLGAKAQAPPWFFINTGVENTHIVLVLPSTPMTIDGQQLAVGDYIAAFYQVGTLEFCGTGTGDTGDQGGMPITGQNYAATIWGAEPNVFNGFQQGEAFRWKVWRSSDGSVFDAVATYDLSIPQITDSGVYVTNGISALGSLTAFSIPGKNVSINAQTAPESGCFLGAMEVVSIVLQNHDTLPISQFDLNLSVNNGAIYTTFFDDTIPAGGFFTFTFDTLINMSEPGDYFFHAWAELDGDVNTTNDYNKKTITHFAEPVIDLGSDTTICAGDTTIIFLNEVWDYYSWNTGEDTYYVEASNPGWYVLTVLNEGECPGTDSVYLSNYNKPEIVLRDTIQYCEEGYANVKIQERFRSFRWSNGLQKPSLYVTFPGTYTVTVEDFAGCFWTDSLTAIEVPIPPVDLGPDIRTNAPDTILLDAGNPGATFSWSTGESSQVIATPNYGNYGVTVSIGACSNEDNVLILAEEVDPPVEEFTYHFYQNLTQDQVLIEIFKPNQDRCELFNQLGQFIQAYELTQFSNRISLQHLLPGIYFFRLSINDEDFIEKIVVL